MNASSRDVFLSHRATDKDIVRRLAGDIESELYKGRSLLTWVDEAEIRPGQSITGMVNQGLECSRFVALIMTPAYFASESGWTDAEWHAALFLDPDNRKARVIPLIAQDCPYIPVLLRHLVAIDLRGDEYEHGLKRLLSVLKDEPLPRPYAHRGQLITGGLRIDRSTLIAERAVPDADPDVVTERLYSNLLPVERYPRYIYMAGVRSDLLRTRADGSQTQPTKAELREEIRIWQEREAVPEEARFMPAFRLFEGRVLTLHDLEDDDGPLNAIIDENDIEQYDVKTFLGEEDLRRLLISLMNMSLARHIDRCGLVIDQAKRHRYFFPSKNGEPRTITWKPLRKRASRTVAKPVVREGNTLFWRHLGAYLQFIYLADSLYLKISPTWVISDDGCTASGGPDIGKRVSRWTNPERNLHVLYHVRFWTSILRDRRPGLISIRTGDQSIEVATVPAAIQQSYGISGDNRDLMRLLDEEAPTIAAEEDDIADEALIESVESPGEEETELEEFEGDEDETDAQE